jgi:hypothetical protein
MASKGSVLDAESILARSTFVEEPRGTVSKPDAASMLRTAAMMVLCGWAT